MTEWHDDDDKNSPQGARQPGGEGERVWIPRELIRRGEAPAGAVHTWLWLRCLWQDSGAGCAFSMEELAELSGKSQATLYEHLRVLKQVGALRWVREGKGRLRVVFEGEALTPARSCAEEQRSGERGEEAGIQETGIQNSGIAPSLNKDSLNKGLRGEGKFQKGGIGNSGNLEGEGAPCGVSAEAIFRAFTGRRPNQAQRALLREQVEDLGRWRETLGHWLAHGWNPTNLAGMLELYQRGGAGACRFCGEAKGGKGGKPKEREDPFEEALKEIQAKRRGGDG